MPAQLVPSPGLKPVFPAVLSNISAPNNILCYTKTTGYYTFVFSSMIDTNINTDLTLIAIMLFNEYLGSTYPTIIYANNIEPGVYSSSNVTSGAYNQFTNGELFYDVNGNVVTTIPKYDNVNTSVLSTIQPLINDIQPYWTTGNQQYYTAIPIDPVVAPPSPTKICMAQQRLVVAVP